jgi:PAS domain S-box-containing protein
VKDTDRPEVPPGHRAGAAPTSLGAEILDQLAEAVLITDAAGRYVEVNLAAANLLGRTRAEVLGLSVADVHAGPRERTEAEFARLSDEGFWHGTVALRRKDGSIVEVDARASMLETAEGRWNVTIARESDVGERAPLEAAERRLAAVARSSDDAIFSMTLDGVIDTWNAGAERVYGYRQEEIVGQHVRITAPPERRYEVDENLQRALAGEPVRKETVRLAKGGDRIDLAITVSPILDSDGTVTGISQVSRDISDRRRVERGSQLLSELARSIASSATEDDLADAALDAVQRALQVERSGFLLPEDDVLSFRASRGMSSKLREAIEHLHASFLGSGPEPTTIPDVEVEPELADRRDAIRGEGVRAMAFLPLTHGGEAMGAAVVCFEEPRDLSSEESRLVIALCGQVATAIARHRAERALTEARDTLALLTVGAGDGITIQDSEGRLRYANGAAARLSGFDSVEAMLAAEPAARLVSWTIIDEDGNPMPTEQLPGRRVLAGEAEADAVLRVRDERDGHEFWSLVRSTGTFAEGGTVRYAINVFRDITSQKLAELAAQRQATLMSHLYAITARLSETTDREVIAEAIADLSVSPIGADRGAVVVRSEDGGTLETLAARGFDGDLIEPWRRFPLDGRTPIGEAVQTNRPVVMPDREAWRRSYPDLDPERIPAAAAAIPLDVGGRAIGGIALSFDEPRTLSDDVIEFILAAARQGAQALERARSEAIRRRAEDRLAILAQAGGLLEDTLDYQGTLAAVADLVVPRLADWATVELLDPNGAIRSVAISHVDPAQVVLAREFRARRPPDPSSPSGVGRVIATGEPELVPQITEEMLEAIEDPAVVEIVRQLDLRSAMVVPLNARGRTLGALSLVWAESGNTYTAADLEFARTLAARMALVIDNARLFRDRDHVARTLQQSLLPPQLPEIEGIELAGRYLPAGEGIDIGGDFFDAFEIGDGEWSLALGDVCGKGPDAAALMVMVRHTIRAAAMRERAPVRVLSTLNAAVAGQSREDQFCTVITARIRPQPERVLTWLSVAGHPPPLVLRADGSIRWVRRSGDVLGIFQDAELAEVEMALVPGDTLVLYTDGVTDERNAEGQEFGEEGLLAAVTSASGTSAAEIVERIETAVLSHGSGEPHDDIAVLAMRVTG